MSEESIPQMREQIESLTADLSSARASEETALGKVKDLTGQVIALEQGYTKAQGGLYAKVAEGDLSAEGFDVFAQEQGLPQRQAPASAEGGKSASADEGDPATPAEGSSNLANMGRGGSRPGESAGGATTERMTRQEWQELHANDPAAAREAVRQGRVEIAKDNPFGDARAVAQGTNPYA
jgi:hypothetical protein